METIYTHVNEPIRLVSCDMLNIKGRYTLSEQYLEFDYLSSGEKCLFTFSENTGTIRKMFFLRSLLC